MSWTTDQSYEFGDGSGNGAAADSHGFYYGHQQQQQQPDQYGGGFGGYGGNSYMTPGPISASSGSVDEEEANEPPLLEELGINPEHIALKTLSVLNPFRKTRPEVASDADLAGPLAFCLALGSLLLLTGKIHFSYIYSFGGLGCLAIYGLLSLMGAGSSVVGFTSVVSTLGYCILPIVALSAMGVVVSLQGYLGMAAAVVAVTWCSASASNLFVSAFDMQKQQLLVAYPCFLLYGVFALITVF